MRLPDDNLLHCLLAKNKIKNIRLLMYVASVAAEFSFFGRRNNFVSRKDEAKALFFPSGDYRGEGIVLGHCLEPWTQ
jgi:hypothetical protein